MAFNYCEIMKRTAINILEKAGKEIYPKSLRNKVLKKLCAINYSMTIGSVDMKISENDLKENPKKCVEFIMKILQMSRRTAYDYYTALLYVKFHQIALMEFAYEQVLKEKDK